VALDVVDILIKDIPPIGNNELEALKQISSEYNPSDDDVLFLKEILGQKLQQTEILSKARQYFQNKDKNAISKEDFSKEIGVDSSKLPIQVITEVLPKKIDIDKKDVLLLHDKPFLINLIVSHEMRIRSLSQEVNALSQQREDDGRKLKELESSVSSFETWKSDLLSKLDEHDIGDAMKKIESLMSEMNGLREKVVRFENESKRQEKADETNVAIEKDNYDGHSSVSEKEAVDPFNNQEQGSSDLQQDGIVGENASKESIENVEQDVNNDRPKGLKKFFSVFAKKKRNENENKEEVSMNALDDALKDQVGVSSVNTDNKKKTGGIIKLAILLFIVMLLVGGFMILKNWLIKSNAERVAQNAPIITIEKDKIDAFQKKVQQEQKALLSVKNSTIKVADKEAQNTNSKSLLNIEDDLDLVMTDDGTDSLPKAKEVSAVDKREYAEGKIKSNEQIESLDKDTQDKQEDAVADIEANARPNKDDASASLKEDAKGTKNSILENINQDWILPDEIKNTQSDMKKEEEKNQKEIVKSHNNTQKKVQPEVIKEDTRSHDNTAKKEKADVVNKEIKEEEVKEKIFNEAQLISIGDKVEVYTDYIQYEGTKFFKGDSFFGNTILLIKMPNKIYFMGDDGKTIIYHSTYRENQK
jgi:hypothetical protein